MEVLQKVATEYTRCMDPLTQEASRRLVPDAEFLRVQEQLREATVIIPAHPEPLTQRGEFETQADYEARKRAYEDRLIARAKAIVAWSAGLKVKPALEEKLMALRSAAIQKAAERLYDDRYGKTGYEVFLDVDCRFSMDENIFRVYLKKPAEINGGFDNREIDYPNKWSMRNHEDYRKGTLRIPSLPKAGINISLPDLTLSGGDDILMVVTGFTSIEQAKLFKKLYPEKLTVSIRFPVHNRPRIDYSLIEGSEGFSGKVLSANLPPAPEYGFIGGRSEFEQNVPGKPMAHNYKVTLGSDASEIVVTPRFPEDFALNWLTPGQYKTMRDAKSHPPVPNSRTK